MLHFQPRFSKRIWFKPCLILSLQVFFGCIFYQGAAWGQGTTNGKGDISKKLELAEKGDVKNQRDLGFIYRDGLGVAKDEKVAFSWFQKAADQGDKNAQREVGYAYLTGTGVYETPSLAFDWFRKSAEQGDAQADCYVGYCYLKGVGVEKNPAEAIKWFKKSAEKGNLWAMVNLGFCYRDGSGTTANDEEALKWFSKAAEQNDVAAQYLLGIMYINGQGCAKNEKKGFDLIYKSAEKGQLDAQYNLAVCYLNGTGVEKNFAEALKWFTKSAEKGDPGSLSSLGAIYYFGTQTPKDLNQAFNYFKQAAEKDDLEAQINLSQCYFYGNGTEKNQEEGLKWIERAAKGGSKKAIYLLTRNVLEKIATEKTDQLSFHKTVLFMKQNILSLLEQPLIDGEYENNFYIGKGFLELNRFAEAKNAFLKSGNFGGFIGGSIEPEKMKRLDMDSPGSDWVVAILDSDNSYIGSGVFFGNEGWVITAAHVVAGKTELKIRDTSMNTWMAKGVFPGDFENDVAILKTDAQGHPAATEIGSEPMLLETVWMVGHPMGIFMPVLSSGVVSQYDFLTSTLKIQMPALPGNSGSPVFNKKLELVGIAYANRFFAKGKRDGQTSETDVLETKTLKKFVQDAKQNPEFYKLEKIKEWKNKGPSWDWESNSQIRDYHRALEMISGTYEKADKEKALKILEATADAGLLSAQAELEKHQKSGANNAETKTRALKSNEAEKNPFSGKWISEYLALEIPKEKFWIWIIFTLTLFLISSYKCGKMLFSKHMPRMLKISTGLFGFFFCILTAYGCLFLTNIEKMQNSSTVTSALIYAFFSCLLFLFILILLNLVARGSKAGLVVGILSEIGFFSLMTFAYLRAGINGFYSYDMILWILLPLVAGWVCFVNLSKVGFEYRRDKRKELKPLPRDLKTAALLFSFALFYIFIQGFIASEYPVGKTLLIVLFTLGVFATLLAVLFYGLKWGDFLCLFAFRLFLFFWLLIFLLLNYGLFINGGTINQIINHSLVTGLLLVSLVFGFTRKVKDWSLSNSAAY